MMVGEAIKLILGSGQPLIGEMMIYDALYSDVRKFRTKAKAACPICGSGDATDATLNKG
jgi:molybdopterin/thiamine biosynthesis adenylyltransferase